MWQILCHKHGRSQNVRWAQAQVKAGEAASCCSDCKTITRNSWAIGQTSPSGPPSPGRSRKDTTHLVAGTHPSGRLLREVPNLPLATGTDQMFPNGRASSRRKPASALLASRPRKTKTEGGPVPDRRDGGDASP